MATRRVARAGGLVCGILLALSGASTAVAVRAPSLAAAEPNESVAGNHVTVCDEAHLTAALGTITDVTVIFDCSGTIVLSHQIYVQAYSRLTMDGNGYSVTLSGGNATRILFVMDSTTVYLAGLSFVNGLDAPSAGSDGTNGTGGNGGFTFMAGGGAIHNMGTMTIVSCTFSNNRALGNRGGNGGSGAAGAAGVAGGNGGKGGDGGAAGGGAIFNQGTLTLIDTTFSDNQAIGGQGGVGGAGGSGGDGLSPSSGDGGNGGNGGNGGDGGAGGAAKGGTILSWGDISMAGVTISGSRAVAGAGGRAGNGGHGGKGGDSVDAYPGNAGNGGNGGNGGKSGAAMGGSFFSTGTSQLADVTATASTEQAAAGGSGGNGGTSGAPGNGSYPGGDGAGGDAGNGGDSDQASASAWFDYHAEIADDTVVIQDSTQTAASGGLPGSAGAGSPPGNPGDGGANSVLGNPVTHFEYVPTAGFDIADYDPPNISLNVAYSASFTTVRGRGAVNWQVLGTLPTGLSLNPTTGVLSGVPTAVGSYTFKLWASDTPGFMDFPRNGVRTYTLSTPTSYTAITPPARVLDTRPDTADGGIKNIGLVGKFTAGTARIFGVAGVTFVGGGAAIAVPAGAIAVTGNLTVTNASASGVIVLGPVVAGSATTTLNFARGETRANNVTMGLDSNGKLSAVLNAAAGARVDLVFDVTGYFELNQAGATYHATPPGRILDTRPSSGGIKHIGLTGKFRHSIARTVTVAGIVPVGGTTELVPASANPTAITANVTVTNATSGGFVSIAPVMPSLPKFSNLNVAKGQNVANGVTVALNGGTTVDAVWFGAAGSSADLIIDVTGYFTADGTGLRFYPVTPYRALDTTNGTGLSGVFRSGTARTLAVAGMTAGGVVCYAPGIAGNLTLVSPSSGAYAFIAPSITGTPSSSTVNTNRRVTVANGFDVLLGSGNVMLFVSGTAGATANLQLDINGYWK